MTELLELVVARGSRVKIQADEHPAYPRAFRKLKKIDIDLSVTSSKRPRTATNPLFPVNRMDLLIRHTSANHKRETIAFSKRRQSAMERMAIFSVWVNYQKSVSEKKRDATPAQRLGIFKHKLTTREVLSRRRFRDRVRLPSAWLKHYEGRIPTRARRCAQPPRHRFLA